MRAEVNQSISARTRPAVHNADPLTPCTKLTLTTSAIAPSMPEFLDFAVRLRPVSILEC